jgi:hypothetical protein
LDYQHAFHILIRDWLVFLLRGEAECVMLLLKNWSWGPSGLILQHRGVDFDLARAPKAMEKVWAILPGLPLVFWSKDSLEYLGNKIGKFLALNLVWESKVDRRWAWVQVEVNLRDSFLGEVIFMHGENIWRQWINDWCFPFCCFFCHETG